MRTALVLLLGFACQDSDKDKEREKMLKAPFDVMEKSIRDNTEKSFKEQWHAEGYEKNFVGSSGLAGNEVFGQGARKKWFLKPDLTKVRLMGDGAVVIVQCEIWAWEKEKAVDKVQILLVKTEVKAGEKVTTSYIVLGGGEKHGQVEALANRFLKKEPLEPPKDDQKEEK